MGSQGAARSQNKPGRKGPRPGCFWPPRPGLTPGSRICFIPLVLPFAQQRTLYAPTTRPRVAGVPRAQNGNMLPSASHWPQQSKRRLCGPTNAPCASHCCVDGAMLLRQAGGGAHVCARAEPFDVHMETLRRIGDASTSTIERTDDQPPLTPRDMIECHSSHTSTTSILANHFCHGYRLPLLVLGSSPSLRGALHLWGLEVPEVRLQLALSYAPCLKPRVASRQLQPRG